MCLNKLINWGHKREFWISTWCLGFLAAMAQNSEHATLYFNRILLSWDTLQSICENCHCPTIWTVVVTCSKYSLILLVVVICIVLFKRQVIESPDYMRPVRIQASMRLVSIQMLVSGYMMLVWTIISCPLHSFRLLNDSDRSEVEPQNHVNMNWFETDQRSLFWACMRKSVVEP